MATTALSAAATGVSFAKDDDKKKECYEFRTYELKGDQHFIHDYFSKALIPALNKLGVKKVGAFTEIGKTEPTKLYLLIAYPSLDSFSSINAQLKKDKDYFAASTEYNQLPVDKPAYFSLETSLMIAFDGLPTLVAPANSPRIFELRTYMGYSEDAVQRKIKMFNLEEFPIFYKTKLTPVFFGEVIAGPNLPCLTYMITFKNMEERDASWKAFSADPDWQRVSKLPEYANTVSRINKVFLEPTAYSQV